MKDIDIKELGIKIRQKKLRKPQLGYFNPKTLTIVINSEQSEALKHSTLIHEFIHAVDYQLQDTKVSKRPIPHKTIEHLAPNLLTLFSLAGFWRGISKKQVWKFFTGLEETQKK